MSEQYNQKWREAILGLTKTDLADMVERICRERDGLYIRAKNAEAALEEAIRYVKAHPSEDNWDGDFLQKYGGLK